MAGETELDILIANMQPVMVEGVYVFATVAAGGDYSDLHPLMVFQEREGVTLILEQAAADSANIAAEFPCRMITLNIHSSLKAVGFLAEVTNALKDEGMGVNPVSAFYHDHLFVPADRAEDAMAALKRLSAGRRGSGGH